MTKYYYHNSNYIKKQREAKLGEKNPNWKGGVSKLKIAKYPQGYNFHQDLEFRKKHSVAMKEWHKNHAHPRGALGKHINLGKKRLDMKEKMLKNNPMKNPETVKKQSETRKKLIAEGKIKIWDKGVKRPEVSQIFKRLRKQPEFIRKLLSSLQKRPTKPEQKLIEIINKNNLPFSYVGNGQMIIEGKCPDFIDNNGSKKIIEVFGNYWHKPEEEKTRKEVFAKYGFQTLIIWENELKNLPEIEILNKIGGFIDG